MSQDQASARRNHTRLDINGVDLEFRVFPGPVDRPTLVFLHEGLGSVDLWRDFPDKLARRLGLRTIVYSRQGYGGSAGLQGPRMPQFMHDEALSVLPAIRRVLNIEQAILVGHSDGASIALIHGASAAVRDEGFETKALVLMAPHVFVEPLSVEAIAKTRDVYAASSAAPEGLRTRLGRYHTHVDDAFYGWANVWLSPAFRDWSLMAEVGRLTMPTLLIQGSDDTYGTLAQINAIAGAMPGPSQKLILNGGGHSPYRDREGATLDAISGFVERVAGLAH